MNTKQQNALRSLLKKYEYKNASTVVRQAMGINFENLLQKGDVLYIIPRIASCYAEEDKRKQLMTAVYKEWLKDVAVKRWLSHLDPYIEKHGWRTVLQAIYYLMDNGLWETYEGRISLDDDWSDDYFKLQDMPAAIAKVEELNSDTDKEEEPKETEEETPRAAAETVVSAEEAVKCANGADIAIETLIDSIHKMTDYVRTAADTDGLRATIAAQQQKMAEQQKQTEELRAKLEEADRTMLKASDYISKQKETIAEMEKNYDILDGKYKKALDERDAADHDLEACKKLLEEESRKEQLPKKKVIPFSVLDDVPLLGKGVMTGLVPVLAKYNIVVDYNR